MSGSKSLKEETNKVNRQIIMDKCNSAEAQYELFVCDFSNWIVVRCDSHNGKDYVKKLLKIKGFEICKKKDADHYSSLQKKGSEFSVLNFWLRKITNN